MFKRWLSFNKNKSSLILGPRRCGKTSFLKNSFSDLKYVTLDDLDYLEWAKKDPKGFVADLGQKAIIDEIQRLPGLTIAVKYAIDNLNAQFFMTGSSSLGLLDAAVDTLAGRIAIHSLPTACWGEDSGEPEHSIFHEEIDPVKIRKAQRLLKPAVEYGQFPEVLTQPEDTDK